MSSPYNLEIISHNPEFAGKVMRQHQIEGIPSVGVYGSERFSIRFKNNSHQKVQVIISIDGTSILSGKKASTENVSLKDMFVVGAYSNLELNAWCENNEGGSALIFTNAANGVAVNTHGDISSQGIIAAAVFTEGELLKLEKHYYNHYYWTYPYYCNHVWCNCGCGQTYGSSSLIYGNGDLTLTGGTIGTSQSLTFNSSYSGGGTLSVSALNIDTQSSAQTNDSTYFTANSIAAVGAGEYTEQHLKTAAGLNKPILTETIRVRYLWWNELQEKLKEQKDALPHGSGFPEDNPRFNLSGVPKTISPIVASKAQKVAKEPQRFL